MSSTFAYEGHAARLNLHSFPTRRSSDLVGTICGDDTLFVAVRDAADAPAFARTLQGLRSDRDPWSVRANAGASAADRKSTRLNSSHGYISYAVFCLKKKNTHNKHMNRRT